ncbi:MAG: ubiquitin-like protein Pup [Actinobacteria bacterium]|nr:ubiquitin-like protein Pup [Actinomycetota bacterium]
MAQEHKDKISSKQTEEIEEIQAKDVKNEELDASVEDTLSKIDEELDDMDGILDEIDDVLEENAQEFVSQFVQKGGQ